MGKLVERILAGKFRIPNFQRPFVWRQQDVHALLDSVYRGFPIGSILVWETEEEFGSVRDVGPIRVKSRPPGLISYLLDGQQRVSALVGTLQLPSDSEPIHNGVDWRVYFDLEKSEFVRNPRGGTMAQHFPLASLLNTSGFLDAARRILNVKDENQRHRWLNSADHLANAFRDYQLPLIRIREASLDSAVSVFARLNRTGRKISAYQMVSALTYRTGEFNLADALDSLQLKLCSRGFGNFDRRFLFRAVLAALNCDIYAKDWAGLIVREDIRPRLREGCESASRGIADALGFLESLGITSDRLLPYGLQLVLLGEFYRICPDPTPEVMSLLERWFWVTSFSGWFGIVSSSKVTQALDEVRSLARNEKKSFSVVNLDEQALPFPDRFDGRSARVRTFSLYLSSLNPLSIKHRGETLKTGELLSRLGSNAIKYVYYAPQEADEFSSIPGNRIFFDDELNNAFDHFQNVQDDDYLMKLLSSHGFPEEALQILRDGKRSEFIRARQEYLIRGEREFMTKKRVKLPEENTGKIVADSDVSDTESP